MSKYQQLANLLGNRQTKKLKHCTYICKGDDWEEGDVIFIQHHATPILTVWPDDTVQINNGGWYTSTTKARLNEYMSDLGIPYSIHQRKYIWYITGPEGEALFSGKLIFNPEGKAVRLQERVVIPSTDISEKNRKASNFLELREEHKRRQEALGLFTLGVI